MSSEVLDKFNVTLTLLPKLDMTVITSCYKELKSIISNYEKILIIMVNGRDAMAAHS